MARFQPADNIGLYFANNPRYHSEGRIGEGAFGVVYKIVDTQAGGGYPQRLALKVPISNEFGGYDSDNERPMSEAEVLDGFRAALHVVNRIEVNDDPLWKLVPGTRRITEGWMYLEYLQNGTFRQFTTRLLAMNRVAPNRLIWPITLCLVRMCIAMAWPLAYVNGNPRIEGVQEGNYPVIVTNTDLHDENMMFGDLTADWGLEHQLVPILKMIDVGECELEETPSGEKWLEKTFNLLDTITDHIVTLCYRGARQSPDDVPLDPDLESLATMTSEQAVNLRQVAAGVTDAVVTRTQLWYQWKYPQLDASLESNESVRDLVRSIFFDAGQPFSSIFP